MMPSLFIIGVVLSLLIVLRNSLFIATVISQSMLPTFNIGDRVLAIHHWPICWLRKGQIVIVRPVTTAPTVHFEPFRIIPSVKRVVGMPGDVITYSPSSSIIEKSGIFLKLVVPKNYFYVCGDSYLRDNIPTKLMSIPYDNLIGMVLIRLPCRQINKTYGENSAGNNKGKRYG